MKINNFVSKKEIIISNNIADAMHIAICFDKNHIMPAGFFITSILENNTDHNFHFHLFCLSIDDIDKQKLKLFQSEKINISLYYV